MLLVPLALVAGAGSLFGTSLSVTAGATTTVTCSTSGGPGAVASVTVKNTTAGSVSVASLTGLPTGVSVITPASSSFPVSVPSNGTLTVTFNYAVGCNGAGASSANGSDTTAHFMIGATADATLTAVNYTYTVNGTSLTTSPSSVTVTCLLNGGSYTPNGANVSLSSTASGGTPFTVASQPGWITLSSGPYNANPSQSITFTPNDCTGAVGSSISGTVTFVTYPATVTKSINVTLLVVGPSPLTIATPATKTYTKGATNPIYPSWTVTVDSSLTGLYFSINPTSLPAWLTPSATGGLTTNSGVNITFQATNLLDSMNAGPQSATVVFQVTGYANASVAVNLVIDNPASKLTVVGGTSQNLTWIQGQSIPTANITAVSSDAPISFTISTSGVVSQPSQTSGVAYSFGTVIPVSFNVLSFSEAQPGNVLTGTETLTWGSNTIVITFNITVQTASGSAVITGISPPNLPTAAAGQVFTVNLYGTGFIPSADPTVRTTVGIVSSGAIQSDAAVSANVVNSSNIILTITVPASDPLLPWSNQTVTFGVCNPSGGSCTVPTGTIGLLIGAGPIISSVTSASKATSVSSVAPYDILTIWGSNFCSSNGTGCSSTQVLYGQPNPATYTYPSSLSPDNGQRNLTVTFQTGNTVNATAPLLFATNNQINLLVPGALTAGSQTLVVNFGGLSSVGTAITIAQTDPGVFTLNQDGTGDAAVLKTNWSIVGGANPVVLDSYNNSGAGTPSDSVSIYGTGLGVPGSGPASCISIATYESLAGGLSNLDGVIIQSGLLSASGNNSLPPCFSTSSTPPVVTIGGGSGHPATLTFAGWVANAVTGLYQLNVTLPYADSATTYVDASGGSAHALTYPVQLPVKITFGGNSSQTTGTVWADPRLDFTAFPTSQTVDVSGSLSSGNVATALGGSGTYTYTCTNCSSISGAAASGSETYTLASSPTAGVYVVTVTASDNNTIPITNKKAFTLTLTDTTNSPTMLTPSATAVTSSTAGVANPAVTTITGGGGNPAPVLPYTYALNSAPTGISIDPNLGVVSTTTAALAGTYHLSATVTDSTSGTAHTGNIYFDVPVAFSSITSSNGTNLTANHGVTGQTITTVTATGGGTINYTIPRTGIGSGCTAAVGLTSGVVTTTGCSAGQTYFITVVATDTAPPSGADGAVATIDLAVTMQ
jgi:uncharacterized protein (TIGR03437 family)